MTEAKKAKGGGTRAGQRKIGANASIEIGAKATYEVKKTVQEVIPEDVTRDKAKAWLTLLSPLTQWAGLKGDQLAHKRELLRLHQEETLTAIAIRAKGRIKTLKNPKPVPLKFFIPFLEKASLEESDSPLVDLWANLLVSAAENYDPHFVHFAGMISQLSSQQAQAFVDVLGTDDAYMLEITSDMLRMDYLHNFMQDYLLEYYDKLKEKPEKVDNMYAFMEATLNVIGIEVKHVVVEDMNNVEGWLSGEIPVTKYRDELRTDFAILDAMRLINYVDTGFFRIDKNWKVKVMFYYVTALGRAFAEACGIAKVSEKDKVIR